MKIACIIDSLASGGAERQLTELATGLKSAGHEVGVCYYHYGKPGRSFYDHFIQDKDIHLEKIKTRGVLSKLSKIRRWLKSFKPDIVQSYLSGPNAIAILTGLGPKNWKVIVSERIVTNYNHTQSRRLKAIAQLYRLADWIVCNSHESHHTLVEYIGGLRSKSSVIWNCVDLERFNVPHSKGNGDSFRLTCVASMSGRKNAPKLLEALDIVRSRSNRKFCLKWVGNCNRKIEDHVVTIAKTKRLVEELKLNNCFTYIGEVTNIENEYRESDAMVLVSLNEGLPNTVCEGMASGLPIVASKVADIPLMVMDNENGFLCDPLDIGSIADALLKLLCLDPDRVAALGRNSRMKAEQMFSKQAFIEQHERLYFHLLK